MKEENVLGGGSGIGNGIGGGFGCSVAHDAASKPEWDGEGLPPVGCECEGKQLAQLNWNKFKVVAIENGHVFGFWNDNVSTALDSRKWEFRPIRSEADKKRDEIIEALKEGLGHAHGLYDLMQIYRLLKNGKIPHIRID